MSLLLNRPIPRSSIELGRLVTDPKYPTQDYCQPTVKRENRDVVSGGDDGIGVNLDLEVETQRFEDFSETIERARGTRLEARLLNILSLAPSIPLKNSASVSGPLCVVHEIRNTNEFFSTVCRQPHVRKWLEEQSQRTRSTVYLVCGFKVLTDANVSLTRTNGANFEASVNVPSALVAGAVGIPVPGLDVGAAASVSSETIKKTDYMAVGEQVFAVQYRKVSFSWLARSKADQAYLAKGSRWITYVQARTGDTDGDEDVIECDMAEEINSSDLGGAFMSSDINGETILYRDNIDL